MFFHLVYEINRISAFARGSKTLSSQCICTKVLLLHYSSFWPRLESNPTPGWHKTIRKIHTHVVLVYAIHVKSCANEIRESDALLIQRFFSPLVTFSDVYQTNLLKRLHWCQVKFFKGLMNDAALKYLFLLKLFT